MSRILIVGLGNILFQDEGVGVHILKELENDNQLPRQVELIIGETGGLALLPSLTGAAAIVFVDAAAFDGEPGEVKVYRGNDVHHARGGALSMHDAGLSDLISLLTMISSPAPEMVVVGIRPATLEPGVTVSEPVRTMMPQALAIVRHEVDRLCRSLSCSGV
jgi:hydrogenase maturation protease